MRRVIPKQDLESGQDSFLDVVSNIVGILIILVVIVGAQVKNGLTSSRMREIRDAQSVQNGEKISESRSESEISKSELPESELPEDVGLEDALSSLASEVKTEGVLEKTPQVQAEAQRKEASLPDVKAQKKKLLAEMKESAQNLEKTIAERMEKERIVADVRLQRDRMEAEKTVFAAECVQIETRLKLVQKEMETFTNEKDVENREKLLLSQESVTCDRQIAELEARKRTLAEQQKANGGPKKIVHKETPIIHSVDGREFHYIVDRGRIMYIPMDVLVKELERRMPAMIPTLVQNGVRTETLGPYDGFEMRTEARLAGGSVGLRWKLVPPEIEENGETVADALKPGSKFMYTLEKIDPEKDIVTFWIYPDGFPSFPLLKDAVYRLGFSIASRPLPEGMPISGSPEGQKSVAQ